MAYNINCKKRPETPTPPAGTSVLLHACCAPCSTAVLEWMLEREIRPVLFYCNPNIWPDPEYIIRRDEARAYAARFGLETIEGPRDHAAWREAIRGHELDLERAGRCEICFRQRLLQTAIYARDHGFEYFTTTLATSRWKRWEQVRDAAIWAAQQAPGSTFWEKDWRRGGLVTRRYEMIREIGFYNQLYCGCEFSMRRLPERQERHADDPQAVPSSGIGQNA